MMEAGREFGITAASIKYALDHGREFIKQRKDSEYRFLQTMNGR
jgi:hypothetical protein